MHCRSQPAGAKICILVSLGEVKNQFVGGTWAEPWGVFHEGKEGIFLEAAVSWWCWGHCEGFRWGQKVFKVPNTLLAVAERDMLMPALALVISDGFGFPALQDAQRRVGIISKLKKVVFCFLHFSSKSSCLAEQQQRLGKLLGQQERALFASSSGLTFSFWTGPVHGGTGSLPGKPLVRD